jgi:hypothetical protein
MALLGTLTSAYAAERSARRPRRTRTPLLVHAGRLAARVLPRWATIRTLLLSLAGFGCLTAAAWSVATWAGLAVAGVSLLLIEYLTSSSDR